MQQAATGHRSMTSGETLAFRSAKYVPGAPFQRGVSTVDVTTGQRQGQDCIDQSEC